MPLLHNGFPLRVFIPTYRSYETNESSRNRLLAEIIGAIVLSTHIPLLKAFLILGWRFPL